MAAKNGVATHPWHPDDPDHEKSRLEAAIDAATARAAAARQRAAERDAEVRAALRNELESSKRVLAEMDRAHEVRVALIREAALAEAEAQLAKRAEELEQIRQQVEQQIARLTAGDDARIAQLVKVYEAMKPKQAAEVFDRLELELLTRVASRIREAKMAAILAAMDPEKARRVTIELARRLSPRPEPNSG